MCLSCPSKVPYRSPKVPNRSPVVPIGPLKCLRCPPKIPLRSPKMLKVPDRSRFILVGERHKISFPTGRRAKRPAKRVSEQVLSNYQLSIIIIQSWGPCNSN